MNIYFIVVSLALLTNLSLACSGGSGGSSPIEEETTAPKTPSTVQKSPSSRPSPSDEEIDETPKTLCMKSKQAKYLPPGDEDIFIGMTLKEFIAAKGTDSFIFSYPSSSKTYFDAKKVETGDRENTSYSFDASCPARLRTVMIQYSSEFDLPSLVDAVGYDTGDTDDFSGFNFDLGEKSFKLRIWTINDYLGGSLLGLQAKHPSYIQFSCEEEGEDKRLANITDINGNAIDECYVKPETGTTGSGGGGSGSGQWSEPGSFRKWMKGSLISQTWQEAARRCSASSGFRLPSVFELETAHGKGIKDALKISISDSEVWSSDDGLLPDTKKVVDLYGAMPLTSSKNNDSFTRNYVLCVSPN